MTAELVIMNKKALAIAADSAVTTMGGKVFSSENKIFQLSRYEPVAILIWDSAYFMGVPFEILVKKFRKDILNSRSYNNLNTYSKSFIKYLQDLDDLSSKDQEDAYIKSQIISYYEFISNKMKNILLEKESIEEKDKFSEIMNEIVNEIIRNDNFFFSKLENIKSVKSNFLQQYQDRILQINRKIQEDRFRDMKIDEIKLQENVISIFIKAGLREQPYKQKTGVAICGYGNSQIFPSLKSFLLYGVLGNILLYESYYDYEINHRQESCIRAFAQTEMINSFLFGVHPYFYDEILNMIGDLLNNIPESVIKSIKELNVDQKTRYSEIWGGKEIRNDLFDIVNNELFQKSHKLHYQPILEIVKILPKDELANMAEVLINLTSFKRKVSFGAETVGGPIDVAVLSKGDGFVWIKRKHYFNKELNQQYFVNYERGYINVQSRRKKTSDSE